MFNWIRKTLKNKTAKPLIFLKRNRLTQNSPHKSLFQAALHIQPPPSPVETWRTYNLDEKTLDRISVSRLIELLADVSPEVSRALWDFLRFCNPGYTAIVTRPGQTEMDQTGQDILNQMVKQLDDLYGTSDVVINRLFMGAFLRGAFLGEVVLDDDGNFADFATPDPFVARFRQVAHPVRGQIWELGQNKNNKWVSFENEPTVQYIPIDPLPGNPYGRPLVNPAINTSLFLIGLLHDLRRVVAQQGYPRLDLEINLERLLEAMPDDIEVGTAEFKTWIDGVIGQIDEMYSTLEPDDAYIHTDVVKVNRPVGAIDSSSLAAVDGLIRGLERMSIRALKTMPLLMGSNEGTTESHANRQWEIHMAGIKTLQKTGAKLLSNLFSVAMIAQGKLYHVEFSFDENRASERLRDAQGVAMEIANTRSMYEAGWISQNEASERVTGSPADAPEPRASGAMPDLIQGDNDGGERRRFSQRAVQLIPEGSESPLPPGPQTVEISDGDIMTAVALWNDLMTDYVGLIEAQVVGRTDFVSEDDDFVSGGNSVWAWNQAKKRYKNLESGEIVTQRGLTALRDAFVAVQLSNNRGVAIPSTRGLGDDVDDISDKLIDGQINLQRWLLDMRERTKTAYLVAYSEAKGGVENMTQADYGRIGRMMAPNGQYARLQAFAEAIAEGKLSAAQIRARARQYINSSTQAFERGRAASYGVVLPAYPADGRQACLANCKCEWIIREFEDRWECTWKINQAAEHCETCQANARQWKPLVIPKNEVNSRQNLSEYLERIND